MSGLEEQILEEPEKMYCRVCDEWVEECCWCNIGDACIDCCSGCNE